MQRLIIPFVCVTLLAIVLLILFWESILFAGASVGLFFASQLNVYSFKEVRVFWRYMLCVFLAGIVLWHYGWLLVATLAIAFVALVIMAIGRTKFRKTQFKVRRKMRRLRPSLH